jgi:exodeoxyribonuclease V gamma subunit
MIDQPAPAPGFSLHHGNRLERLVGTLADELRARPADPLTADIVLVPHPGMAQWLKMRLADELGVAANLEFPLPAAWFGQLAGIGTTPEDALVWTRDALTWRIFALREEGLGPLSFADAVGERGQLARWQLASQVAHLLERYQLQRPDWVRAWSAGRLTGGGEGERWQARLWQRLIETANPEERRAIRQRIDVAAVSPAILPQRLFAFGFASLPASYLQRLQAMAEVVPVHLFFANPCRWYWGDLASAREQLSRSRRMGYKPELDPDAEGHPLLAGFGAVGRDFFRQLYAGEAAFVTETEQFDEALSASVLAQLQNGILSLDGNTLEWNESDRSVRLMSAPNRRRELEALHDILLDLLGDRELDLRPHQIAVMVPKLSDYAPLIEAVFGGQPRERRIPWQLTDLAETERHPLAELFLKLIDLPTWRFGLGDVLDALARPSFAAAFGIEPAELPRLSQLLAGAGARWGLDGEFRERMDAGNESVFTFRFALDRLLTGWMVGEGVAFDGEIAPYAALRGSDADLVGRFIACLDTLDRWRTRLLDERSLADWTDTLIALRENCFADSGDDDDEAARLRLMQAVERWSERTRSTDTLVVARRVVRESLSEALHSTSVSALPGEGVNLCAMVPLRGLPFRVIALLGLGEGEFPRRDREQPDDLCRQRPRAGDRSVTAEDRYLFLESIAASREVLLLSHVDVDSETGQPRAPSPVFAEFLDYLRDAAFDGDAAALGNRFEQVARLPFDPRHFDAGGDDRFVPSHVHEWLASPSPPSMRRALEPVAPRDWAELASLFVDPARMQMRWRGVATHDHDDPVDDVEPFALDGLQTFKVRSAIVGALAADADASKTEAAAWLSAAALLPPGHAGRHAFASTWADALRVRERQIQARGDRPLGRVGGVIRLGELTLPVCIDDADGSGVVRSSAGRIKPRRRMAAWLDLVALSLLTGTPGLSATLVGLEGTCVLDAPGQPDAVATRLLELWSQARREPLPIYPATSAAYAESFVARDPDRAAGKAYLAWEGSDFGVSGERHDRACAELARCFPRWDAPPFAALAVELFGPLFGKGTA